MALYEPTVFHLLQQVGGPGAFAYAEIAEVAGRVREGASSQATIAPRLQAFVDSWNGLGAWNAMRPAAQNALIPWAAKGTARVPSGDG